MKDFKKFLEEVDIKGNPGIPGEPDKRRGEPGYLSDVERRAKQRLGIRPEDMPRMTMRGPMPSPKEMRLGSEMMELLGTSIEMSRGNEEALSKLATDVIYNIYKDVIDRYEIELDIKLVRPGRIKPFMDESEDSEMEMPRMRKITDEDTIREIHKRKIVNLIIQGEAKNTKHILHSDEVKDGFEEILGERNGKELFRVLDKLTKNADQLDWMADEQVRAEMMEQMPDGMAGACAVEWKPKDKKEDEKEEKPYQEEQPEDDEYQEEEGSVQFDEMTPILRARGVDFSMLLHEGIKGLFEILSIAGLPVVKDEDNEEDKEKTKELLNKIYANTGLGDEPQDWKYGPEIAADLRDFINQNSDIDKYPNVRAELWKLMVDKETMPTNEFLELMRGILAKTPEARTKVDRLIKKVIDTLDSEKGAEDQYQRDLQQYERDLKDWEKHKSRKEDGDLTGDENEPENDVDKLVKQSLSKKEPEPNAEPDYSRMTPKELDNALNAALDSGDFALAGKIGKFLKNESKIIYERELRIINEKLNPHTK